MKRTGKRSLIVGILSLALVLAATGYAYWTDTLKVSTTASTGSFGVKFVDLGLYAQYGNEILPGGWAIVDGIKHGGDDGFVNDEFFMRGTSDYNAIAKPGSIDQYKEEAKGYNKIDFKAELKDAKPLEKAVGPYTHATANGSDEIVIDIERMYPGYAQAFRSDIVNIGDIAAKLSNLKFEVTSESAAKGDELDMIGIAVLVNREHFTASGGDEDCFKLAKAVNDPAQIFQVGGVDFVRLSALDGMDFSDVLEHDLLLASPASSNRMDIFLAVAMDPDAKGVYTTGTAANINVKNDDAESQGKLAKVVINLLWDQFNVGKDAANPNILKNQNM
ncbi:MAG: signal peptide protein [Bacillota bacterium]|nr:signal peptide protein [Bacillota bacterium]